MKKLISINLIGILLIIAYCGGNDHENKEKKTRRCKKHYIDILLRKVMIFHSLFVLNIILIKQKHLSRKQDTLTEMDCQSLNFL